MSARYDCSKCPAYCCSYDRVDITSRDAKKLARHLKLDVETFLDRYTQVDEGLVVLKQQPDPVYGTTCTFLDLNTRRCTVYGARPATCREYPERPTCGYYDFLRWERRHQGDPQFVPYGLKR
jgi:Fe-S-cluster containining protein